MAVMQAATVDGQTVLDEARGLLGESNGAEHVDLLRRTAALWSGYLDVALSASDVAMMQALQSIARHSNTRQRRNLVSLALLAECADRCHGTAIDRLRESAENGVTTEPNG